MKWRMFPYEKDKRKKKTKIKTEKRSMAKH